ncbi:MAG: TetR/AcrR family transcriptional regulator [Acidimicrobiales bacterium]
MARVRRTAEESRQRILEAAEELLLDGGSAAVEVRAVAARIGMTDAGVKHHFGSRQGLQSALLRRGGRRLRGAVADAVDRATERDALDLRAVIGAIAEVYSEGYGELAIALHAAGWRDDDAGLLDPLVQVLHQARLAVDPAATLAATRRAVAACHLAIAVSPTYGEAFRRSADLVDQAASAHEEMIEWWASTLEVVLGLPGPSGPRG